MKKNNKGFSLVELIVVVLIMAIIATALTLAVTKYVAKSKRSSDANTAGELKTAAETTVTDYLTSVNNLGAGTIKITGAKDTEWDAESSVDGYQDADFESIFKTAAGKTAPTAKVYPQESFNIFITIDDATNATYDVRYTNDTSSAIDIFKEATK